MLKLGVIGYGYWGPNIVRNFNALDNCRVTAVCDQDPKALARMKETYPAVEAVSAVDEMLTSPEIDAIAIVTPVSTHYPFSRKALENGKHIFVEKPFTSTSAQAQELLELAERRGLKIMVDHTFLFTGAVGKMKQLIDDNVLGSLYYYDSMRVNLGLFQHDVNVIWDLAPHDLSIMDYLLPEQPEAVVATGQGHFNGLADIAYLTIYFPNNVLAHINVNWLSPVKVRTTLIGGEKKMLLWNDLDADEKIKLYDKGVDISTREGVYDLLVSYRSGDMWAPRVEQLEALRLETQSFIEYIENGHQVVNDGQAGLRIVRMLEAANESLKERGKMVYL